MKILQIIQKGQLRGAEIFACQLSEELIKQGHEVDVLILSGTENKLTKFKLNFLFANAKLNKRFYDFKAYREIAKIIKNGKYDIVQANASDTLKYAVFSKQIYKWKSKLIFRNANTISNFINNRIKFYLNKYIVSKTDLIISVSKFGKKDIIKLFPNIHDKITYIPIGTYIFDNIKPIKEKKTDKKLWINIGSFVPEKNHLFLIDLFYHYLLKYPNNELWLIGDGELKKEIIHRIKNYKLTNKIKLLGYRTDVIPLLKSADIMIMPSKIEGLPGVILESLSCGIPIVASSTGGIPEVVIDNVTGYVIKQFNIDNYIKNINKILSNKKLYNEFSNNGQKLIKENYLLPIISEKFEKEYKQLLKSNA
jgi:glycosyltransferase involved in cell wall biosynthesis